MSKYIDIEPMIKNLTGMRDKLGYDAISIDGMIKGLLEQEPTVDVVPVVHGHWLTEPSELYTGKFCFECSACHDMFDDETYYCPNCGAKMDEVSE